MPHLSPSPVGRRTVLASAAVVLGLSLSGCGYTIGGPLKATAAPVPTTEFSRLNESGVAQINASKSVRLDFRTGAVAKSDVGLPESAYGPELVAPQGEKYQLSITGSEGTLTAQTDHVRFTTTDSMPTLDIIYYFLTADTAEEYFQLVRDGVKTLGIDQADAERWISGVEADPGKKSNYSQGDGSALGFNVGYDLRYDGSKDTQVVIVTISASS